MVKYTPPIKCTYSRIQEVRVQHDWSNCPHRPRANSGSQEVNKGMRGVMSLLGDQGTPSLTQAGGSPVARDLNTITTPS